ncbi:MAG: hypothetical protein F4X02_10860 [Chloroflexi bacterium]|nr:hypothetical protein [Chloroflexota bacterium]
MPRLLLILTVCGFAFSFAPQSFACSYAFEPSDIKWNTRYEILVAAEVVDVDDVSIGTILKVHRYFKGSGGEYLAVMPYPPALQHAGFIRRYDTGCVYAARSYGGWEKNDFGYLGLSANSNGTYDFGVAFKPLDGTITFFSEDEGNRGDYVTLPAEEFEELLLDLTGQDDTTAPVDNPYPLKRFLNITTESGERYRLNPDRSVTWLDRAKYPIEISNDGSHVMFQLDPGDLGFQYLALLQKPYVPIGVGRVGLAGAALSDGWMSSYGWLHPVKGLFGKFSPNSDFVAVQEETRLVVYLFSSIRLPEAVTGFGYTMAIREVASFDSLQQTTQRQLPLIWSADSNVIAFQDSRGVWLWSFLRESNPQLAVSTGEATELLDLSYSGRYLRLGNNQSWTLLDIHTGESWNNTLISPDESRLIEIRIELADERDRRAEVVRQYKLCSKPLSRCPLVISAGTPRFIFWHDPGFIGLVFSTRLESFPWRFSLEKMCCCCDGRVEGSSLPSIIAFAFDETYMQPAIAFEETQIGFEFDGWYSFDSVDLSEQLDSPIVDLEWGQPIFYEGR